MRDLAYTGHDRVCCCNSGEPYFNHCFYEEQLSSQRSLYLVINLTVADMLAGGIFSVQKFFTVGSHCKFSKFNLGSYGKAVPLYFAIYFLIYLFPLTSLTNIAMISLQQAHATFRPFKHRVIKKWVYGVAIAFVWVLAATVSATLVSLTFFTKPRSHYFYL